jgi:DNA modification methylase
MKVERSTNKAHFLSELERVDWDFTGEPGTDGLAGFHWYPARFAEQIPSILIGYLSEPGETVLDPFCGAGTTLTEALRLNRRPMGIDLNPVAVLMTAAKLQDYGENGAGEFLQGVLESARQHAVRLETTSTEDARAAIQDAGRSDEILRWFNPKTVLEISALLTEIEQASDARFINLGRACISSILRACSSQDKHWGYICDNVRPKTLNYKNTFRFFSRSADQFTRDYSRFRALYDSSRQDSPVSVSFDDVCVLRDDSRDALASIARGSVDLIVTSPPYLNVTDYLDSQRLSLLWLNCATTARRDSEIGARFKRFRRDSLTPYLDDMRTCVEGMASVLKAGRYCCLVVGESGSHAPYIESLIGICKENSLETITRMDRRIPEKRSLSPRIFSESVIVMRKLP